MLFNFHAIVAYITQCHQFSIWEITNCFQIKLNCIFCTFYLSLRHIIIYYTALFSDNSGLLFHLRSKLDTTEQHELLGAVYREIAHFEYVWFVRKQGHSGNMKYMCKHQRFKIYFKRNDYGSRYGYFIYFLHFPWVLHL